MHCSAGCDGDLSEAFWGDRCLPEAPQEGNRRAELVSRHILYSVAFSPCGLRNRSNCLSEGWPNLKEENSLGPAVCFRPAAQRYSLPCPRPYYYSYSINMNIYRTYERQNNEIYGLHYCLSSTLIQPGVASTAPSSSSACPFRVTTLHHLFLASFRISIDLSILTRFRQASPTNRTFLAG